MTAHRWRLDEGRTRPRRSPGSVAFSVGLHVALVIVLARTLAGPVRTLDWFFLVGPEKPREERVTYVRVAAEPVRGGRPDGDDRPVRRERPPPPAVPLVAPAEVPTGIPSAPPAPAPAAEGGGTGAAGIPDGPTAGLVPRFTDPRLWGGRVERAPPAPYSGPVTAGQLDSAITEYIRQHGDSLRRLAQERGLPAWTFDIGGQTYGIDQQYIRLGRFSIPTALLALLPLNIQGNVQALEREQRFASMRAEIQYQAGRAQGEDLFREQVQELRKRREAERQARLRARQPVIATQPTSPPKPSNP